MAAAAQVLAGFGGGLGVHDYRSVLGLAATLHHLHFPHPHLHLHLSHLLGDGYLDRVHIPALAVVYSLLGAGCYATSSVLQQRAASEQPPETSMRPSLLLRLLRSPRWMLGNVADVGGFLFQFLALRQGALALVSPLFVIGLAFSIGGSALVDRRWPTRHEWAASAATVVGLGLFIFVAQPGPGHPRASGLAWSGLFLATAVLSAVAVLLARGTQRRRALFLSVATGILYGVTAAITEHAGHLLDRGFLHILTTWTPYVLVVVSVVGLLANQSAYQAGDLRLSLPMLTVLEPIVAIVIGQLLFGEHIASTGGARLGEVVSLAVMVVGVFWLARTAPAEPLVGVPGPDTVVGRQPEGSVL